MGPSFALFYQRQHSWAFDWLVLNLCLLVRSKYVLWDWGTAHRFWGRKDYARIYFKLTASLLNHEKTRNYVCISKKDGGGQWPESREWASRNKVCMKLSIIYEHDPTSADEVTRNSMSRADQP